MTQLIQTIVLGLLLGGVYALLASGLTLIFGVMDVINVAQGALIILAAFMTWAAWNEIGLDPLLGAVVMTPAMFLIGYGIYIITIRWIQGKPPSTSVILTFGLALIIEGVMGFVWTATLHRATPEYFNQSFTIGDIYLRKAQVYGCAIAIGVLAILYVILRVTWLGRAIRAVSANMSSARLVGVNPSTVAALTFAIGVATTGAGGAIAAVLYPFLPGSHYAWISRLLGIIVLGGMGSLPGAFIAALIMGVAESLAAVTMTSYISPIVFYLILFLTLIFRPQGLMGTVIRKG